MRMDRIVQSIVSDEEGDDPLSLLALMDRGEALQVLEELASNRDPQLRSWAAFAAPKVLTDSAPLLAKLAKDPNPDE